ncbi:TPA: hypothetical protein ACH3X1_008577 [Trebouxia sp. C0004]
MHCMLVHHETLSSHADTCIAMLASYDPAEAQRLRQLLAADHGDGDELMMSVGFVMGTDDDGMVTDANKDDVVCRKIRRPALEAAAQGFCSLDLADHLGHFSGVELAVPLLCGEHYVDVDSLIKCFKFDAEQQDTAGTKSFLETVCASYEIVANRMAVAPRLGDYFARTDAQQGQRLTQAEEQAVIAAMRGDIRADVGMQ